MNDVLTHTRTHTHTPTHADADARRRADTEPAGLVEAREGNDQKLGDESQSSNRNSCQEEK